MALNKLLTRTNPEEILKAIQECPEGPIVLWHYRNVNDRAHRNNRARIALTCDKDGNGVYLFAGHRWRLASRSAEGGGGFALLERIPEVKPDDFHPRKTNGRPDPREWWLAELKKRNIPLQGGNAHSAPHTSTRPNFGYDYSETLE